MHALDARFGKANKTVISQRDVPGVTRGIVPLMHQRGVKAFSEGCNAQVRKMPCRPRTWANFSLLQLFSHRNAWANLHLLGQPNSFLAPDPAPADPDHL